MTESRILDYEIRPANGLTLPGRGTRLCACRRVISGNKVVCHTCAEQIVARAIKEQSERLGQQSEDAPTQDQGTGLRRRLETVPEVHPGA